MELEQYKQVRNERIGQMYAAYHSVNEISRSLGVEKSLVVKILGDLGKNVPKERVKHRYELI